MRILLWSVLPLKLCSTLLASGLSGQLISSPAIRSKIPTGVLPSLFRCLKTFLYFLGAATPTALLKRCFKNSEIRFDALLEWLETKQTNNYYCTGLLINTK